MSNGPVKRVWVVCEDGVPQRVLIATEEEAIRFRDERLKEMVEEFNKPATREKFCLHPTCDVRQVPVMAAVGERLVKINKLPPVQVN